MNVGITSLGAWRGTWSLAVVLGGLVLACGVDPGGPGPNEKLAPTIARFDATPVAAFRGSDVTLAWEVKDAKTISLSADPGGSVLKDSPNVTGTQALKVWKRTIVTLVAVGEGGTTSKSLTIELDSKPFITEFRVTPARAVEGSTVTIAYKAYNAHRVELSRVGVGVVSFQETVAADPVDAQDLVAVERMPQEIFELVARNNDTGEVHRARAVVDVIAPVVIRSFSVTPSTFFGASASARVVWNTEGATTLSLTQDGTPVAAFPGTATGTMTVEVTDTARFALRAENELGSLMAYATISRPKSETEPNDTPATATVLTDSVVARIEPADDLDVYTIIVPAGGNITAETSDGRGGCAIPTFLTLLTRTGSRALAFDEGSGAAAPGGGNCARIDARMRGANDLPAGAYLLVVEGDGVGDYVLSVTINGPRCGNEIVEASTHESCDDGNAAAFDGCDTSCRAEIATTVQAPGGSIPFALPPAPLGHHFSIAIGRGGQSITATVAAASDGSCLDAELVLRDSTGRELGYSSTVDDDCAAIFYPQSMFARDLSVGIYTIDVAGLTASSVAAKLDIQIIEPACGNGLLEARAGEACDDKNQDPGDGCSSTCAFEGARVLEIEPNDSSTLSTNSGAQIGSRVTVVGSIAPGADDVDFWSFDVPVGRTATLLAVSFVSEVDRTVCDDLHDNELYLLNANGAELAASDDSTEEVNYCGWLTPVVVGAPVQNLPAGRYYLKIQSFDQGNTIDRYYIDIELQ